jgi:NADH dehydrogenase
MDGGLTAAILLSPPLYLRTNRFFVQTMGSTSVTLIQHGDRVIPELNHQSLSDFTLKKLRQNGIEVLLRTAAAEVTTRSVVLKSGSLLPSKLIVNTIGTKPVELISRLGLELDRGRIKTDPSMRVPDTGNLWRRVKLFMQHGCST